MYNEKPNRKETARGFIVADMFIILLIFCVVVSPIVVALWFTGILVPRNAKDWFVFIYELLLLIATICFLSLVLYNRLKRRRTAKAESAKDKA